MLNATYKKILEKMPVGVFVFDGKFRVKYTNESFRRAFSSQAEKGLLKSVFPCGEQENCGQGDACTYCAFFKAMKAAVQTDEEQMKRCKGLSIQTVEWTVSHPESAFIPSKRGNCIWGLLKAVIKAKWKENFCLQEKFSNGFCRLRERVWQGYATRICTYLVRT